MRQHLESTVVKHLSDSPDGAGLLGPRYGSASFWMQRPSQGIIHGGQPKPRAPGAEVVFEEGERSV